MALHYAINRGESRQHTVVWSQHLYASTSASENGSMGIAHDLEAQVRAAIGPPILTAVSAVPKALSSSRLSRRPFAAPRAQLRGFRNA